MKRFHAFLLALSVLFAPIAFAEEAAPVYVNVFTAHVRLGHQPQYEAGIKNLWMVMKKSGADFPIFVNQSGDSPGDYNFVTLLDSMADIDAQNTVFGRVAAQNPETFAELGKHSTGSNTYIIALRPDLSYQPDKPRLTNDESQFAYRTSLHTTGENAQAVEEGLRAFVELNRKHGIRDGFNVSQNVTGAGPVYRIRTLAKSQVDYFTQDEIDEAKLGEEAAAIRARVGPLLTKIEYSWGFRRVDLSYQP